MESLKLQSLKVFLGEMVMLQSRIGNLGTIFKSGNDGVKLGIERQSRIFHYTGRGKVYEYYAGAIKDS